MDKGFNATAGCLLGLLHEGPANGADLFARAQERIGSFWSMTRSQVYRELPILEGLGLVSVVGRGRRRSVQYAITSQGKRAFKKWLPSLGFSDSMRIPVLAFAEFSHVLDEKTVRGIFDSEILRRHRARSDANNAVEAAYNRAGPVAAEVSEFAVSFQAIVLDWLVRRIQPIKGGD